MTRNRNETLPRSAGGGIERGIATDSDHSALRACLSERASLCTLVGIDGGFSRRLGAQLAVGDKDVLGGSLADGCLEQQLVRDVKEARSEGRPRLVHYGKGSKYIDFRLPCGSGLVILVEPFPDWQQVGRIVAALDDRQPAALPLQFPETPSANLLQERPYIPSLRLQLFGEGPELRWVSSLAGAMGIETEIHTKLGTPNGSLSLGCSPAGVKADAWTAILLLFHDHEWEEALLAWALETPAFLIGAQGGRVTRETRLEMLIAKGVDATAISRIRSPIGLIPHCREPSELALSALAEIVGEYDKLRRERFRRGRG